MHVFELEQQHDWFHRRHERAMRVLDVLAAIGQAGRERRSLSEILETVQRELARLFIFDACSIAVCDERVGHFRCALLAEGSIARFVEHVEWGRLAGMLVTRSEPLLFRDLTTECPLQAPLTLLDRHARDARAWLGAPLVAGAQAIGVMTLQSRQAGIYDETDLDLLSRIANIIAAVVKNAVLIEQGERLRASLADQVSARTEELAALNTIASSLVERRPLNEILDRALDVVLQLFGLDAGNVHLLDPDGAHLTLCCQRGFPETYARQTYRISLVYPVRSVVETRKPIVASERWYEYHRGTTLPLEVLPPFECSLTLPLLAGAMVIGTLSLFGFTPRSFSEHEIRLAQSVANQMAIIIENRRLLEERERQIAELQALGEVSRAATTAHDTRTLLQRVHAALKGFFPLDVFSLVVFDPERGIITDGLAIDERQIHTFWNGEPPAPRSLTAHVLRTGEELHFHDLPVDLSAYPDLEITLTASMRPSRSWLGMPLRDRDGRVIGMISVQSYTPAMFGPRDAAFLRNVATQVALHIQNVRLLVQREHQIAELEAIGKIGKVVTASYDLDAMLDAIYGVFRDLLGAPVFALLICDPETMLLTNAVFVKQGKRVPLDLVGRQMAPGSLSHWIATHRQPLLFHDLLHQADEVARHGIQPHSVGEGRPVRSWAGVPVLARDGELIGVLSIQDYRPYRYDRETLDFLHQVASHVSLGVQKVRLFEERERLLTEARAHAKAAQQQAHRLELVNRIASLLSARLDPQEVLRIATRELVHLFWADHSGAVLFTDHEVGVVVAEYPDAGVGGMTIPLGNNPLVAHLLATRRPVVIEDVEHDPLAATSRDAWRAMGIASLIVAPLVSRDRVLGSISLDNYGQRLRVSEEELELISTVATAIAAAVENAQLFAAEQEQRRTADTLREVARVLNSTFDLNEVLQLVLAELQKVIAFDTASIMLLDGSTLRLVAARGRVSAVEPRVQTLSVEGSAAGYVVQSRKPMRYIAGQNDGPWRSLPTSANICSWIGVPLIARGRVVGVLNIDSRRPGPGQPSDLYLGRIFTERDVEVAGAFANHAALAIENARLYQESVARVEQELEIARRIQANLFPRQLPTVAGLELAARCLPARETGGDFYDVLELGTRVGVIVGDVSGKSLPAAMLMAVARSTARSEVRDHEIPAIVLREINRSLVDDVPPNSFVALSYALVDRVRQRLVLASAGHLTPLLRHADGRTRFLEGPPALPLGLFSHATFGQFEVDLQPGDTLLFYTDGIVEAQDRCRNLFGFDRLEHLMQRWGHLPAAQVAERILAEVQSFSEGMSPHDDMTLVVVRIT